MAADGLITLPSPNTEDPNRDNTADGNSECLPFNSHRINLTVPIQEQ
jgi:hypothetical protein